MSAMAFGAYFDFFNPNIRYPEYYHRHEFFHYYLGSKYTQELGYKRIYECAAAAEIDMGKGAEVRRRELRDLRVNLIKPNTAPDVAAHIDECKPRFSPKKWEAFKKDVAWFAQVSRGGYWDNMQKDHGYNPPPVLDDGGQVLLVIWERRGPLLQSARVHGHTVPSGMRRDAILGLRVARGGHCDGILGV